jgi:hypothetical protein
VSVIEDCACWREPDFLLVDGQLLPPENTVWIDVNGQRILSDVLAESAVKKYAQLA